MIHIPHRKAPLTPSILFQFHAHLNLRDSAHLALWCALLVGFFTFFRTANLVPQTFDSLSYLEAASTSPIPAPVSQSPEPKLGKRVIQPLSFRFPSFPDRRFAQPPLSSYY